MGYEDPEELRSLLPFLIYYGEHYIKNYIRLKCIETLEKAAFTTHIYGKGWNDLEFKNIKINPEVDFTHALKIMQQSKIVLNATPTLSSGCHEGVFSAMLNGAVALTNTSTFYKQEFFQNKEIVRFQWQNLQNLPETINSLLSKPQKIQDIATNSQEKALQNHTWINRSKEILEIIKTCSITYAL